MSEKVEIKNRFDGSVICTGDTLLEAVMNNLSNLGSADLGSADLRSADLGYADLGSADLGYANLRSANLRYANLRSANLGSADLGSADLRYADLGYANLRSAELRYAELSYADLSYADLGYADLGYANLRSAELRYAKIAWSSHDLLSEILRRAAGDDIAKLKAAGLILMCREKCWKSFLEMRDPLAGWAIGVLAERVQENDGAPEAVVKARG